MNFIEAVKQMVAGEKLIRKKWSGCGYYVSIISGQSYMWTIPFSGDKPVVNAGIYTPTIDDIFGEDWDIRK